MFNEVRSLTGSQDVTEAEIAESAAYLLKKQFIFREQHGDRRHYAFIDKYWLLFEKAFAFFGATLEIYHEAGFMGYKPMRDFSSLKIVETSILLVLRLLYHDEKISGASEFSAVMISGERFYSAYRKLTGRDDLATKGSLNEALTPLRQKSIIRMGDEDSESDMRDIIILPSIEVVVDKEHATNLLDGIINAAANNKQKELIDEAE